MLPLLLAVAVGVASVLLVTLADRGQVVAPPDALPVEAKEHWTPAKPPQGDTVALAIDFGNGARREFAALPWSRGMTVGELMRQARRFRPAIAFTQQGAGDKAFLTSLEGVTNQGGDGRYWTYQIDHRPAKMSFDVQPLAPGERVLWEFGRAE